MENKKDKNNTKSDVNFVFDRTLREILQGIPKKFIELLTGKTVIELLDPNFPKVEERNADFVVRLNDNTIFHLEVQTQNDDAMPNRMLKYYLLIRELYNQPPFQMVLWIGDGQCSIKNEINEANLYFKFLLKDLKDIDCETLLESDDPNDNILAILCKRKEGFWKRLYPKIIRLPEKQREDYFRKIIYMVRLRKQAVIELKNFMKEEKTMPIVIDKRQDFLFQEGVEEGIKEGIKEGIEEGSILTLKNSVSGIIERKFGAIHDNLANKINSINSKDKLMSLLLDVIRFENIREFEETVDKIITE